MPVIPALCPVFRIFYWCLLLSRHGCNLTVHYRFAVEVFNLRYTCIKSSSNPPRVSDSVSSKTNILRRSRGAMRRSCLTALSGWRLGSLSAHLTDFQTGHLFSAFPFSMIFYFLSLFEVFTLPSWKWKLNMSFKHMETVSLNSDAFQSDYCTSFSWNCFDHISSLGVQQIFSQYVSFPTKEIL